MRIVVLGGGFSGCVVTRELTLRGHDVILIEKNSYLGGGAHTNFFGGHPYTEGPHPLFVNNEDIFNYIHRIVPMRKFHLLEHSYIEGDKQFYSYPIHWDDIEKMPDRDQIRYELSNRPEKITETNLEDVYIQAIGKTLYEKYIKNYTKKMWKVSDNRVFTEHYWSVTGSFIKHGDRIVEFEKGCPYLAYPIEETGYNRFFEYCVKDASVFFEQTITNLDLENKIVNVGGESICCDSIVSTISLDELFQYRYGDLKYMGKDFYPIVLPIEYIFKDDDCLHFLNYPNSEPYTRIVEFKKLTRHKSEDTLLIMEVPSFRGKLYPYSTTVEQEKAKKYKENLPKNVYSIGRLGTYKYLTIGECIKMAQELAVKMSM